MKVSDMPSTMPSLRQSEILLKYLETRSGQRVAEFDQMQERFSQKVSVLESSLQGALVNTKG